MTSTPQKLQLVASVPSAGTLPERSDDELMTLAQAGSRDAFGVLVERYGRSVAQTCARMLNDSELGVELSQETWVAVWAQRAQYRVPGQLRPWLITVARNRCRSRLRKQGVARRYAEDAARAEALDLSSAEQIDRLLAQERQHKVRKGLAQLPELMREALLLRYSEELRYDEMAAVLSASESTLRSRVHHGLKLLRAWLEGES